MARIVDTTSRIGINKVEAIINNEFEWIFREQLRQDYGIDAQIEVVESGNPTGKIIALQIKTGLSHFKEKKDGLIYYGTLRHLRYWTDHSLPVLIIAHIPETDKTYWAFVHPDNIQPTKTKWKILLPYTHELTLDSLDELSEISNGPPEVQKLRRLSLDRGLMEFINKGERVIIYTEKWVNKSLGRGPIQVIVQNSKGEEYIDKEWFLYYVGYDIESLIKHEFPWADVSIDDDYYDIYFERENVESMLGRHLPDIYPYDITGSEVAEYRLELTLNELGKSFLIVSDYLKV